MQRLRNASSLARLVLAWFALALGAAIASPLVQPAGLDVVCSAGGLVKVVPHGGDGDTASHHTIECPLCMSLDAPPPVAAVAVHAQPAHRAAIWQVATPAAQLQRDGPLPGRGPPAIATLA